MTALQGSAAIIRAIARGFSRSSSPRLGATTSTSLGKRQRAKLLADLASSAEKEEAHSSRALLGQAAAAAGVVRGQQRLPPGAVVEVPFHGREQARLEGVLRRPAELGVELA